MRFRQPRGGPGRAREALLVEVHVVQLALRRIEVPLELSGAAMLPAASLTLSPGVQASPRYVRPCHVSTWAAATRPPALWGEKPATEARPEAAFNRRSRALIKPTTLRRANRSGVDTDILMQ
jgi:hypothetical protein